MVQGQTFQRKQAQRVYSGCQKNVPIAERFFATTLMPPSFFRNINMTSGITGALFTCLLRRLLGEVLTINEGTGLIF
jgi:hypothetical protein